MVLDRIALDIGERAGGLCSTVSDNARVSLQSDTAESDVGGSGYSQTSSDLEIPREGGQQQIVGVRFQGVDIPRGATVTDARIEFIIDSTSASGYNAPIDVLIIGENMSGSRDTFSSIRRWDLLMRM